MKYQSFNRFIKNTSWYIAYFAILIHLIGLYHLTVL